MSWIKLIKKSFFLKILIPMLLLTIVSHTLVAIVGGSEVNIIIRKLMDEQIKETTEAILRHRTAYIDQEAKSINTDFEKVEQNLSLIQRQAEALYNSNTSSDLTTINVEKHPSGFYWEPISNPHQYSNVFISAVSGNNKDLLLKKLLIAKQLEPLFIQTVENEPSLKGIYFCLPESAWLIYPGLNVPYEILTNKLPPDIRVQDYEFFYLADATHNPSKKIQWTGIYKDVTQWDWVVTATIPVYKANGELQGVLGADFPLTNISNRVKQIKFDEPNSYSFIVDKRGAFITGDEIGFQKLNQSYENLSFPIQNQDFKPRKFQNESGESFYHLSSPIPNTSWILFHVFSENNIAQPIVDQTKKQTEPHLHQFYKRSLFFLVLTVILLSILSYFYSVKITNPINKLIKTIRLSMDGQYGKQITVETYDEIGNLTKTFNEMNQTISMLIKKLNERADLLEDRVDERTKELKLTNQILSNTYQKLKQLEDARTEFILQIAHDLKTPLTKVKGFLQVIQKFNLPLNEQKKYIDLILLQTNHIIKLINDLFELTHLNTNEIKFEKEWLSIDFLTDHSIEIVTQEENKTDVQIIKDYAKELPLVYIDANKMSRALLNILGNSIKYSKENERCVLHIKIYQHMNDVILSIRDNGIGISEEGLERIFEPYYRDKNSKSEITGSGLGMSIAKKIIEGHEGDITIKSELNTGTSVTIKLPIVID